MPDCVTFADTRWEPTSVYEHLQCPRDGLSCPLWVLDNRRSLREDVKALTSHSSPRDHAEIPVYLKGCEGWGDGIGEEYEGTTVSKRDRDDIDWCLGRKISHVLDTG